MIWVPELSGPGGDFLADQRLLFVSSGSAKGYQVNWNSFV
jgi:hypothetical protein